MVYTINWWNYLFCLVAECQSIVPNCAKCLDSFRCRKCRNDFHAFFNKSGMVCVLRCPRGLVAANSSYFGNYCKKPLVGRLRTSVLASHNLSQKDARERLKSHFIPKKYTLELSVVGSCKKSHVFLARSFWSKDDFFECDDRLELYI